MKEAPFCTLLFYQVLVKFHQDAGRLGADSGASRVDGAIVVAVDQLVAVGPGHSSFLPIGYGVSARECAQIALCGQITALVLGIVEEHLGELLAGDAVCGLENAVPIGRNCWS